MNHVVASHEGLVYTRRSRYAWKKGKREYLSETQPADSWVDMEFTVFPPPMLLPATWKRYGYTTEDAYRTFDKVDVAYVWQLALLFLNDYADNDAITSAIRVTFKSMYEFLFISRKVLVSTFVDAQKASFLDAQKPLSGLLPSCQGTTCGVKSQGSGLLDTPKGILCLERNDHKPCLPKMTSAAPDEFAFFLQQTPIRPPTFYTITRYARAMIVKDVLLVPVAYEDPMIWMMRVVPKAVYDTIPVLPKLCAVTSPALVQLDSHPGQMFVLVHESSWLSPQGFQPTTEPAPRKESGRKRKRNST